jgi:hypothetical protein
VNRDGYASGTRSEAVTGESALPALIKLALTIQR